MVYCPGPSPLKCAREPNLPSSEIGEAGALCAGAHRTPPGLSIEHGVEVCQLRKFKNSVDISSPPTYNFHISIWRYHIETRTTPADSCHLAKQRERRP